jgi:GxxExxY protein
MHHGGTEDTEKTEDLEKALILYESLSNDVIGAAIEVHRILGPGLMESAYVHCLRHELTLRGVPFRFEVNLPVSYKGVNLDCGYRMDFVVDEKIVLEIKAVEELHPIHEAQLITYLKLSGFRVGLLFNFNTAVLKNGMMRRVR